MQEIIHVVVVNDGLEIMKTLYYQNCYHMKTFSVQKSKGYIKNYIFCFWNFRL